MSCTVMYQPYAMSYSSSCDRTSSSDKAPSPSDSLASETSSYNSPGPGPMSVGTTPSSHSSAASISQSSRRPLTPVAGSAGTSATIVTSRSSSSSATATRSSLSESQSHEESPITSHHHHHHPHHNNNHTNHSSTSSASHHSHLSHLSQSHRAHYLSANCVVFVHYNGDVSRVVDEHFSRALSAAYATDKSSKGSPMSTRNFPPSFWNSNYQPSKPLASYGAAAEFYGAAVEYGATIPSLAHHHQTDPWHYPLPPPHQSYHRPTEIPYPSMPSSSRFNAAAQYGSFLLAGAASSGAGRFPVIPGSSQCNVKGDSGGWGSGRYHHHHHDSLSDLHLADYSAAAAAAHYSNMTAGLETSVPDASKDLYWF